MTKKRFASFSIAICLATTCLSSNVTHAKDPDLYFYPKLKWTVEHVETSAPNELETCTLSNQLNNGYIVQLAGNAQGFSNLNIDFRQDAFKEGMKYEVQYSVPGIATEIIPTKAFKKSLLVSDMRAHKSFSKELQNASVLDVTIRENAFRIYLTGLDAAMPNYNECIGINSAPKNHVATIENDILESITAKAQEDNRAMPPPITESSTQVQKVADIPQQNLRPEAKNTPRYTEILAEKLKQESAEYKPEQPEETKASATEPEASAFDAASVVSEQAAVEIPEEPKQNIVTENYRTPEIEYTISKNEEPIIADLAKMQDEQNAEIAAQRIEPASGMQSDEFVQMRNKISELEERVYSLSSENNQLNEELKDTLKDSADEKLSVSSNNWNLELATMKYNESERQIMRLGRQLQTSKVMCQKEKSELERMLFDPQLTNQQQISKLASLESDLENTKGELTRQQRQYEERIKLLEARLNGQ